VDIVWYERRDEVVEEVKILLGAEKGVPADDIVPAAQDIFTHRTTAAKIVYERLSLDEKGKIQKQVERSGKEENPPEIQQR
jgi:hypothetical protein